MPLDWHFATPIYHAALLSQRHKNQALAKEICKTSVDIRKFDVQGQQWSRVHYQHGFTSYSSWDNLHQRHSDFATLQGHIDRHVQRFAKALDWDLQGRELGMTHCWLNIMGAGATHPFHLHPLSALSGTYYADVDSKSAALQFEDPRIGFKMASPPVRTHSKQSPYVEIAPKKGDLVLFESWVKHSVPVHRAKRNRVSVSFNYAWF